MQKRFDPSADEKGSPEVSAKPDRPPMAHFYGEYDEHGVDLSLLRYMLRLSPLERLKLMEQHARDVQILYEYGQRHREAQTASNR